MDNIEKRLDRIEGKVDKMSDAMKGNSYGNEGYAQRLAGLERFMKQAQKLIWMAIGASAFISAVIGIFIKVV